MEERDTDEGGAGLLSPTVWTDPLVPVRVDLTLDGHRIMDAFTWNLEETQITPEDFAARWIREAELPRGFQNPIAVTIREQLKEYVPPIDPRGVAHDAERNHSGEPNHPRLNAATPAVHLPESRHVIRLEIRVGRVILHDQFEWDIHCSENSPEAFAALLSADLGLAAEFVPQIAQSIREQVLDLSEGVQSGAIVTSVASNINPSGQRVRDDGLLLALREPDDIFRNVPVPAAAGGEWGGPVVERLTLDELERIERKESREARLARRNRGKSWSGPMDVSMMPGVNVSGANSRRRTTISVATGDGDSRRVARSGRRR